MPMCADGGEHRRVNGEVEARGEGDGAQHAHRVFAKPYFRVANRAHHTRAEVVEAADVVDDRKRGDVVDQGVDREVAPEGVLFGRPERVVMVNQVFAFGGTRIGRGDTVLHDLFTGYDLPPERC